MKWIECGENHCTFFLCQKVFSGINVLLSLKYNERFCVCKCVCECVRDWFRSTESSLHQSWVHSCPLPSLIASPSAGQE